MKPVLALAVYLLASTCANAKTQGCSTNWLGYETSRTSLTGTFERRVFFGPPNYGEDPSHDRVETVSLLYLELGINVADNATSEGNDAFSCEKIVQIVMQSGWHWPKDGTLVNVGGVLMQGHNGHHRTHILIIADEFQAMP